MPIALLRIAANGVATHRHAACKFSVAYSHLTQVCGQQFAKGLQLLQLCIARAAK